MSNKGFRPEDILPDEQNFIALNGIKVRKGTIGAVLRSASILASYSANQIEKEEAKKAIVELAPALVVLGMHEHVIWKNPDIQKEIEIAAEKLRKKT